METRLQMLLVPGYRDSELPIFDLNLGSNKKSTEKITLLPLAVLVFGARLKIVSRGGNNGGVSIFGKNIGSLLADKEPLD